MIVLYNQFLWNKYFYYLTPPVLKLNVALNVYNWIYKNRKYITTKRERNFPGHMRKHEEMSYPKCGLFLHNNLQNNKQTHKNGKYF